MAARRLGVAILIGAGLFCGGCGGGAPATPTDFVEIPGLGSTRIDVPRPTTEGSECAVSMRADQSIGERVVALRELGLFADRPDLSNEDISQRVEARLDELYGGELLADDPLLELIVASLDESRVWWGDLEADVGDGNDVYVSTLEQWAAISKGAFEPEDVRETWDAEDGPVTVTFTLDGENVELKPEYLEDWIDPRILAPINDQIADSGRRFELFQAFDQSAFVMALSDRERDALEARGWCFE
jgi:hypothetical protein